MDTHDLIRDTLQAVDRVGFRVCDLRVDNQMLRRALALALESSDLARCSHPRCRRLATCAELIGGEPVFGLVFCDAHHVEARSTRTLVRADEARFIEMALGVSADGMGYQ